MKYSIEIEGGFTGIPRKYEGTIDLPEESVSALIELMNATIPPNSKLRDGLLYRITLFDHEKAIEANFDEKNLPEIIRQLI